MRRLKSFIPAVGLCAAFASPATALPIGFTDQVIYAGLNQPTAMVFAPDGRMFIGERGGAVRVAVGGTLLPTPVLTLPVELFEEQGLLGLELHPQFPDSSYLYVCYTRFTGRDNENFNLVSRFVLNGNVASPASEQVLMDDIPTGHGYHVAGDMHFAPDGNLFVSTGENGWGEAFPLQNDRLEGKMLRLRATGGAAPGNPLIGVSGARPEIWQLGLRNPFRFTVHPLTGVAYIADVGEISFEEINAAGPGANFGFPTYEGPAAPSPPWHTNPWYSYDHSITAAITGIAFYTGATFPPVYSRNLFFVDHARGEIGRIVQTAGGGIQSVTFPWGMTTVSGWLQGPVSLISGPDGALWYNTYDPGDIHRIAYQPVTGVAPQLRSFDLAPAMPNPFQRSTTLAFSLAAAGQARLRVFDLSGRAVRTLADGAFAAGPQVLEWDGASDAGAALAAGVYFARLETAAGTRTQRMVRTR